MESIDNKILEKIKKAKRGTLFYTEDFLSFGNYKAVSGNVLNMLVFFINGKYQLEF